MVREEIKKKFKELNELLSNAVLNQEDSSIQDIEEGLTKNFDRIYELIQLNLFQKESSNQGLIAIIQLNLLESSNLLLKNEAIHSNDFKSNPILLAFVHQNQLLIDFLKLNFSKKFQYTFLAPYVYQLAIIPNILNQLSSLLKELHHHQVDDVLLKMIEMYFVEMSQSPQTLTFEKINQAELLLNALEEVEGQYHQSKLIAQLIKWNFNIHPFIDYCVDQIIHAELSTSNSYLVFDWKKALLKTSLIAPFDKNQPHLKAVIKEALVEAGKREKLEKSSLSELNPSTKFYFNVKLTLNQLLFFFQVFQESGILQSKTRTGIFHFIANHIGTDKHQNLSVGSMQRKFGRTSQSEMKKVRDVIIAMLNLTNKKLSAK